MKIHINKNSILFLYYFLNLAKILQENLNENAAMQVYGTSTMAEVLARANGLEQNAQLTGGFRLKIPNLIAEDRNWQGDFPAYDPSQIIGVNCTH